MRLLHIIASVDPAYGGPIEGLLRQDAVTRNQGVNRTVVSCDAPGATFLKEFPVAVHALGLPDAAQPHSSLAHYRYSPRMIPWLRENAPRYDAVLVHGLWNYSTYAASKVLPKSRVPYFVFTHGMLDPWFRRQYPRKHLLKQCFWAFCEGPLLSGARKVLFTSEEERLQARGQFLGWPYDEAVVGYGTVSPPTKSPHDRDAFYEIAPAVAQHPYILFLSRIHEKKGVDLLVQAYSALLTQTDLHLVVAGPDHHGLTAKLRSLARECGASDRIHWPGPLYGRAKWGALHNAEAFVLPSHQENFGIAVAEALACGTPVLISDQVNIWREIAAGGAGLVGPDTLEGVKEVLSRWLSLGEAEKRNMRTAAAETFHRHFDMANTAPQTIGLIARCL